MRETLHMGNCLRNKKCSMILLGGCVLVTILAMYLFWSIKLSGYSMPIQHKVSYSGEFTTTLGAVREIVIWHEKVEEPVEISVSIYNSGNKKCWENSYDHVIITGKKQTLDSFEKETPLQLDKGTYHAEILVNGQKENLGCRFIEYNGSYKELYRALCVLLVVGEIIFLILSKNKKISLHGIYFWGVITLGVILNFAMPPLGVPDEQSHFLTAYELSSKMMMQVKYDENGYLMIREEDYDSINYLHDISSIAEWYDSFHVLSVEEKEQLVSAGVKSSVGSKGLYAYLPMAIGVTIARLLGLSGHMLLWIGRLCNLFVVAALTALAVKIIPWGKFFFLVLGMLPEVVYLFTSYSYDGLNLALCMLIVAYFLKLYAEKDKIVAKEIILFCVLLVLMIFIKTVYIAFGALLLLLPVRKIKLSKMQIIGMGIVFCSGIFMVLRFILPGVLGTMGMNKTLLDYSDPSTRMTLEFALQNKTHSLMALWDTVFENTNTYFNNALCEIIGYGRYDGHDCYYLPICLILVIVVLMLIGLEDTRENLVPGWKRIVCISMGIFTYLAVLVSMFFAFTAISAHKITGVQGRYFLPIFALMPVIVKNNYFEIKCSKRTACFMGMGIVNLMFIFLMCFHYVTTYFV